MADLGRAWRCSGGVCERCGGLPESAERAQNDGKRREALIAETSSGIRVFERWPRSAKLPDLAWHANCHGREGRDSCHSRMYSSCPHRYLGGDTCRRGPALWARAGPHSTAAALVRRCLSCNTQAAARPRENEKRREAMKVNERQNPRSGAVSESFTRLRKHPEADS